ncbi:Flp family type IVb pilin [Novosphingopyxis sp. YJ-S2-01]|uniref:Flp family type IVb pilin n=1 Tax=Novosphingopyxis sp. YJ-S2-01 TaxID=2794021 RepID=UPI002FC27E10
MTTSSKWEMRSMKQWIHRILHEQDGATAVEYGLIAALVVIAMIGALSSMSGTTIQMWNSVSTNVVDATK